MREIRPGGEGVEVRGSGDLLQWRAEGLASAITDPGQQAEALSAVAGAAAGAGEFDRAEGLAGAITVPRERAATLIMLAQLLLDQSNAPGPAGSLAFSGHVAAWLKH
jgi:hypothetical protein